MFAIFDNFKMKVYTCRISCIPHDAQFVALLNGVSFFDTDRFQVGIYRLISIAMVDNNDVPVAALFASKGYFPVIRCLDRPI